MANPTLEMMHGMLYGKGLRFGHPSGLARIIAAMTGDHADVIPFFGPQIHDHAMTVAKVPARLYYWNAELLVDTHLAVDRWYSFDSDTIVADAYNFEVEALGAKMIYSDNAMPTVDVSHPLIKEPSDLDKIGPFDPSKGRIPMAVEVGQLFLEKAPGPFAGGFFCSHWSLICQAMGYPKAVRALKRDKGFATALFDWANDRVLYPYMQAFAKAGVKNANGADAWACFPDLTPELIEEWVVPYALKLRQQCKKELRHDRCSGYGCRGLLRGGSRQVRQGHDVQVLGGCDQDHAAECCLLGHGPHPGLEHGLAAGICPPKGQRRASNSHHGLAEWALHARQHA